MTKICFTQIEGKWRGFTLSGHTGKADFGQDVLCSALSTASQMAVVAITEVAGLKADVQIKDGYLSLKLDEPSPESELIIEALYKTLSSICEQEKKYVKLEVRNDY